MFFNASTLLSLSHNFKCRVMSNFRQSIKTLFHGNVEYMNACFFARDEADAALRSYVIQGALTRLLALQAGHMQGTPTSVVETLLAEANAVDISRELETVSRREKRGHADPNLECPRCRHKGSCISKQVHDRLGSDEGATRYVSCSACGAVTRQR